MLSCNLWVDMGLVNGAADSEGGALFLLQLKHCIDIVKSCAAHFVVYSVKCELDQLCDGLSTMGFIELCRKKPGLMRSLFLPQHPPPLTAYYMIINVFSTRFSPQGSNLR